MSLPVSQLIPLDAPLPAQGNDTGGNTRMSINPGMFSSATDQHNTPKWLVEKIAKFLNGIELDPCTNESNPCGAARFFTEATDGLGHVWKARTVYMNPPYGREIGNWTFSLVDNYERKHFFQGIALLPARTDTGWWQGIAAYPVCFIRGRLKFNDCGQSAPFPSALLYVGNNWWGFKEAFEDIGLIYLPTIGIEQAKPVTTVHAMPATTGEEAK